MLVQGATDLTGGDAIERAEPCLDGKHLVWSSRRGGGVWERTRWWSYCMPCGCTHLLTEEPDALTRWTTAEVWPSPRDGRVAVAVGDEVRILDLASNRVLDRMGRAEAATLAAGAAGAPKGEYLPALLTPPDPLEAGRRFWAAYFSIEEGRPVLVDMVTRAPVKVEVVPLAAVPPNDTGSFVHWHGHARPLTDLVVTHADGTRERLVNSHPSQALRWVAGTVVFALFDVPFGLVQHGTNLTCRLPIEWHARAR